MRSLYVHILVEIFTRRGLELKDDDRTKGRKLRNGHICSAILLTSHLLRAMLELRSFLGYSLMSLPLLIQEFNTPTLTQLTPFLNI